MVFRKITVSLIIDIVTLVCDFRIEKFWGFQNLGLLGSVMADYVNVVDNNLDVTLVNLMCWCSVFSLKFGLLDKIELLLSSQF